jgi:toxin-antitoxin system PIN domain toxin
VIVPDVNVLLYAVVSGFPQHARAREWWEETLNSPVRVGLTQPVIFGFLRIGTSGRVLDSPLPVADAVGYVDSWLAQPNVDLLVPGPSHLRIALNLLTDAGTAGNLTTDAQIAAYALENQGEICSNDTDFARFPSVKWVNPLN